MFYSFLFFLTLNVFFVFVRHQVYYMPDIPELHAVRAVLERDAHNVSFWEQAQQVLLSSPA